MSSKFYEWAFAAFAPVCPNRTGIEYKALNGLPDKYLVYSIIAGNPGGHFSNRFFRQTWRVSFAYHTRDKSELEAKVQEILETGLANGMLYITTSPDRYHRDTTHYVQNVDFYWIEEIAL